MLNIRLQFFAHKKGGGSTKNGRDSESKRLGVKRADGLCSARIYIRFKVFYTAGPVFHGFYVAWEGAVNQEVGVTADHIKVVNLEAIKCFCAVNLAYKFF